MIEFKPLNTLSIYLDKLIQKRLWVKVIIALILGALMGLALNPSSGLIKSELSDTIAKWLDLPGGIFMQLVQMIMIPLIFTSILSGIVSNSKEHLKKMGGPLLIYFIFTTALAIFIGVFFALIFKPGSYLFSLGGFANKTFTSTSEPISASIFEDIPGAISNLIPSNPLHAILNGEMLSIVIFTIIISVAITQLNKATAQPIIKFTEALQKTCMIIVSWAMLIVPYAVFGLIAALISRTGFEVFLGLGYYIIVVLMGLFTLLLAYLVLLFLITKIHPLKFLKSVKNVQLLAFSTASSAAVMPLTMKTADEELGVSSNISDFVIPIGATINMDGTALFQCITCIFIAQAYGIDLTIMNILLMTITVVAASIGTPSIPGGGVIILASVLQSVNIPVDGIVVIIGIDRILGMFRTAINVTGDLVACVVFNHFFGRKDIDNQNKRIN